MGTAFTYSGRLKYQNQPANGSFDLQFKLFDAANGGNQSGQTVAVNGLNIVNGLFVTSLDFGSGVFNGTAYWLEIAARPGGNGPFTLLSPRQPVNPAPYSLFAPVADSANNAAANSVATASIQNNAVTAPKIASGQIVKSLNGLFDNVSLQAGANVSIAPNGNALMISSTGGGSAWSLTGNSGTTAGVNFLGTIDSQPLELRAKNLRALRLEFAGSQFRNSINTLGGVSLNRLSNSPIGATISGGGLYDAINLGGDLPNTVAADFGTIGGGAGHSVGGLYGTIPGGFLNTANGFGSFAGGQLSHANHDGSFVWGDGTGAAYSTAPNSFDALTTGGVNFHTGGNAFKLYGPWFVAQGLGNEQAYLGGDGAGGDVQLGSLNPAVGTIACYNAASGSYMDLYVRTLTITGGGDLAEPFPMAAPDTPAGSVMVIDDENPGQLKLSEAPYDTRVAGVVSGAGGIHPGLSLRQDGKLEVGQNLALTGRVYVLADAGKGAIKPGDLLTTSSTPGHAMKVTDHRRSHGAVLGKAMSTLSEGKGLVLVLVSLQ